MYLDELPMASHTVGWGEVGLRGELGWDGLKARIAGHSYDHSISAHAHSSLMYDLEHLPTVDLFTCRVALCDTSFGPGQYPTVTFEVIADGVSAAAVSHVHNSKPRNLTANIQGVKRLELRVTCPAFEHCHAVWIDPEFQPWPEEGLLDPLGQVRIHRPESPVIADRCIVAMVSPGYARWLDIFLNSLKSNGRCEGAEIVVFRVDEDSACDAVIAAHGAHTVKCTALVPRSATIRPAVFSIGSAARISRVIVAETDMVVLRDISALWDAIAVCADPALLVAREHHRNVPYKLEEFFSDVFHGTYDELARFGASEAERSYDLQINGGLIAGSAEAIASLDHTMREFLPYSRQWVQSRRDLSYREMFVVNLAMARLNNCVRIKPAYNVQLFKGAEKLVENVLPPQFEFRGEPVNVLHFSARKEAYAAVQSYFWHLGNHDQKLAAGLAEVRKAPLKKLRDPAFVASIIRDIGLQETRQLDAAILYGNDFACMNSGAGLYQIPDQLAKSLVFLSDKKIRTYAEVGIFHGWTFAFITAYLHRFTPLERCVALDVEDYFTAFYHVLQDHPVEFIRSDSSAIEGESFDLVFIDANHSYRYAQEDYLRVGRLARYCMFHDVNDFTVAAEQLCGGVIRLWEELKAEQPAACTEFLDHTHNQQVMGIGVLCSTTVA